MSARTEAWHGGDAAIPCSADRQGAAELDLGCACSPLGGLDEQSFKSGKLVSYPPSLSSGLLREAKICLTGI